MPKYCCVNGCPNSGTLRGGNSFYERTLEIDGNVSLSFHKFPKDPVTRQGWILSVRRHNFIPSSHSLVCSAHFKPEDFYPIYASGLKKLRENVVPSIFDFCDKNVKQIKVDDNKKIQPCFCETSSDHISDYPELKVDDNKKIEPCSCQTSSDNISDYPELKVILPPGYSYHVCEWTDLGFDGCFDTLFRVNVSTEETAFQWFKEFQITSRSEYSRSWNGDGIKNMFKLKCDNSTKPKCNHVKHTNCPAKLLITIKEIQEKKQKKQKRNCQSSDIHLPAYPMIVNYRNIHNHQLKNSDNVEATTKPFVHFLRSATENDSGSEIAPDISDTSDDKSEVLKEAENLIVEPDFHAFIDEQFEVDDNDLSDEDFPLDNKEHTIETQKTDLPEVDSLQQIKEGRTEIQKANLPESENKEQTTNTQKTNLPQIDLTQVNKLPVILIQNIIPVPLQNPFLLQTGLTQDKKEQTLKDFLSFANMIVDKCRSNDETFRAVEAFMENVKNMNSEDSINSALVNFGKINRSVNLDKKYTKSSKIRKKIINERIIKEIIINKIKKEKN